MKLWKKVLIGLGALVVLAAAGMTYMIGGPRNVIGMLRYDQREEGTLKVGDRAPEVALLALDGKTPVKLSERLGGKPTVLVFGCFT
jgi:amino acid transporter